MSDVPSESLLRQGVRISSVSIVWTVFTAISSITLGVIAKSLVLIAFGLTGVLDAAGSTALVVHFRHGIKHNVFSERHERIAFLIVTIGLATVAIATLIGSGYRLISGGDSDHSTLGLIISAISIFVLSILAFLKRRIGSSLKSEALKADGILSYTGALLAVITVIGSVLASNGINWADPVAAILVACGALSISVVLNR